MKIPKRRTSSFVGMALALILVSHSVIAAKSRQKGRARLNGGGTGAGTYGHGCRTEGDCAPALRCVDGRCACADLVGSVYSASESRCVKLAGAFCSNSIGSAPCLEGAACDRRHGVCVCKSGLTPSLSGARCVSGDGGGLSYGLSCEARSCDQGKGLACVNGRCGCADTALTYYGVSGRCLAPLGAGCGQRLIAGSCIGGRERCEYYTLACVPGGRCRKEVGDETSGNGGYICRRK